MRNLEVVVIVVIVVWVVFLAGYKLGNQPCLREHDPIPWIIEQPCPGDKGFKGKDGNSV